MQDRVDGYGNGIATYGNGIATVHFMLQGQEIEKLRRDIDYPFRGQRPCQQIQLHMGGYFPHVHVKWA